jgi:acetyl esterase/lipase
MKFSAYARAIRAMPRQITPDTLNATRNLITPLAAPLDADVSVQRDLKYGNHERQRLDLFTPASGFEPARPVLIFVHGGGFVAGDKQMPGTPFYDNIGQWAVRNGYNAVNITYRLAPQHQWPSGIEDLHKVIRFVQEKGAMHGIGAHRIFLMGQSAGAAHAASYVAHSQVYAPHGHGLHGLILLSGVYDYTMKPGPMEAAYLGSDQSLYAPRSSLAGLLQSELPLLVTLAECDPPYFEQQGLALLNALQKKHGQLPRCVHMIGQNHLSVALYLGLAGDLLGPQLRAFIDDHSGRR